jgi:uncharacterized protein (DUF1330 family)
LARDFDQRIGCVDSVVLARGCRGSQSSPGGGKVTSMEGPTPPHRVAITEWENLDKARAFFKSKGWADAKPDRDKALKTIRRYAVEQRN